MSEKIEEWLSILKYQPALRISPVAPKYSASDSAQMILKQTALQQSALYGNSPVFSAVPHESVSLIFADINDLLLERQSIRHSPASVLPDSIRNNRKRRIVVLQSLGVHTGETAPSLSHPIVCDDLLETILIHNVLQAGQLR